MKDSQDDARKSVKAQKDARLRGMSQDQLYARRSGVTSSSPTVSQGTRRYQQDNFFVKRNRIETKTWIGRAFVKGLGPGLGPGLSTQDCIQPCWPPGKAHSRYT